MREERAAAYLFGATMGVDRAAAYFQIGGTIERDPTLIVLRAMVCAAHAARTHGVDDASVERARTGLLAAQRSVLATNEGIATLVGEALRHGRPLESIAA